MEEMKEIIKEEALLKEDKKEEEELKEEMKMEEVKGSMKEVCNELPPHADGLCVDHMTETDSWLSYIMHELPTEMNRDRACQLTLGLDVTDTPQTRTKLTLLLQLLASKIPQYR